MKLYLKRTQLQTFKKKNTDHRGTPEFPGRTATLDPVEGEVCSYHSDQLSQCKAQSSAYCFRQQCTSSMRKRNKGLLNAIICDDLSAYE
ncbi:hypothetical protein RND71_028239 [Anisodus tanguticus]|uniref:Uncharacterized protein n=1 Tax=Anisodus tanguticus TaxID=243964 RepID=A0AAE1V6Y0_9SOLA|nr:hypothetical protein RND71_028239 [Anisodus tanguticus]